MASPWTDESAILRDLSFAQGRWVPGGIESAVAGGRPPTLNITEETEEEYYQRWTTDGDFSAGPDLFRIKKMLELMQDEEAPDDGFPSGPIEISKLNLRSGPVTLQLNPKAVTFIPKAKVTKTKENKDPVPNKPRRARNVAIASIMARNIQVSAAQELKLCKPEDFIKPKDNDVVFEGNNYIDKVANWLLSHDVTKSSMFKKKSSAGAAEADEGSSNERMSTLVDCGTDSTFKPSPVKSQDDSEKSSVRSPKNEPYTPSSWADEYYRKAVDRSHMRDLIRDDVWGRAEKIMKKIDDKAEELRKQQEAALAAELAAAAAALDDDDTDNATATGDTDNVTATGDTDNATATGDTDNVTATGDTDNATATGDTDNVTATGDTDNVTATGDTDNVTATVDTDNATVTQDNNEDTSDGVAHVLLAEHRHALQPAAACAVCAALAARLALMRAW